MSERPTIKIGSQTANCAEIYINGTRIIACSSDEEKDEIRVELNGATIHNGKRIVRNYESGEPLVGRIPEPDAPPFTGYVRGWFEGRK